VYLGWRMTGLGNRTLCHSLCHSLSNPDLFPAFLTLPLSWGNDAHHLTLTAFCQSHEILCWKKNGIYVWKAGPSSITESEPTSVGLSPTSQAQEPGFHCTWWTCGSFHIRCNPHLLQPSPASAASLSMNLSSSPNLQSSLTLFLTLNSSDSSFVILLECTYSLAGVFIEHIITRFFLYTLSLVTQGEYMEASKYLLMVQPLHQLLSSSSWVSILWPFMNT
jgi:hypothetical protein